jgi:hypothetical protein
VCLFVAVETCLPLLLPGNDHAYSLNYSGFQPACHNILHLLLLVKLVTSSISITFHRFYYFCTCCPYGFAAANPVRSEIVCTHCVVAFCVE